MTRFLPALRWWPLVTGDTARADVIAGLVGAVAVLPQGVAFAMLAGLPPEYGLYCAMVPTVIAALFGSSLHAVSGPTTAVSLMVLAVLSPLATPGSPEYLRLALTLSLLCGLLMIAMGLARMGTLVNFMSDAVVVGFTAALAVLILASQLHSMLGIEAQASRSFIALIADTVSRIAETRPWTLLTTVGTIAAGLLSRRLLPRFPAMLSAILAGSLIAAGINAAAGPAQSGLEMLRPLEAVLPPFSLPDFSPATLQSLLGGAIAVTILALTQAISVERAIALRSGQRLDNNQEFIGQGLANLFGAFFSSMPSTASVNRCGLNFDSGARTPLAAVLSAVFLVALIFAVGPLASLLPMAAIAGVLGLVAWNLIDTGFIRRALHTSPGDATVLAITFFATLLLDLEFAICSGVAASLVLYLNRTSRPSLRSLVPDPRHPGRKMAEVERGLHECPQMKILRIEGSIYFGATNHVEQHFDLLRREAPEQKHLLLMSKSINFVDMAGADLIGREAFRRNTMGGALYLYSPRKPVEAILHHGGYMHDIGADHIFRGKDEAFHAVFMRLDRTICSQCRARIFLECKTIPGPDD